MLKKVNYILSNREKIRFVLLMLIYLAGSFVELLGVACIMPLVSVIQTPEIIHRGGAYNKIYDALGMKSDSQFIMLFALGIIIIYILKNLYIIISGAITQRFISKSQLRMQMDMMKYYMYKPYLYHVSTNIAEITRGMGGDVSMFYSTILSIITLINEAILSSMIIVYLLILDKSITIGVILVLSVFSVVYVLLFKSKVLEFGKVCRDLSAERVKWVYQSFEGIKEIKIANSEDIYIREVDRAAYNFTIAGIKNNVINMIPKPLFEMVCISAMMLVVMLKIARGVDLTYFMPVLSAFAIAAFRLLPSFGKFTTLYNAIVYNKIGVDAVYSEMVCRNESVEGKPIEDKLGSIKFDDKIDFTGVTFRYPETKVDVLKNINIAIKKNTSVGLMGPSGAGKTTLVDVMLGLLEPQSGIVSVDGVNVYENLHSWHKLLSYIPQNIYLIDDTIRNNVIFGIDRDEADEEQIWRALEDAQLADFVRSLPNGIETVVGARGVKLSGGQRQRIGIARALYSNPDILVLDEATSALDTETETAVMESIDALKGNKTMIIIAHRLSTIMNCDYIYEVKNGKVMLQDKEQIQKKQLSKKKK